jgi:hypothetical protein
VTLVAFRIADADDHEPVLGDVRGVERERIVEAESFAHPAHRELLSRLPKPHVFASALMPDATA